MLLLKEWGEGKAKKGGLVGNQSMEERLKDEKKK